MSRIRDKIHEKIAKTKNAKKCKKSAKNGQKLDFLKNILKDNAQ
jgi:hypothetical protein